MQTDTKNHFTAVDCPVFYARFALKRKPIEEIGNQYKTYHLDSKNMHACSSDSPRLFESVEYSFEQQTEGRSEKLKSYLKQIGEFSKQSQAAVESSLSWRNNLRTVYTKAPDHYIYFDFEGKISKNKFTSTSLITCILLLACFLLVLVQVLYTLAKSAFGKLIVKGLIVQNNFLTVKVCFKSRLPVSKETNRFLRASVC